MASTVEFIDGAAGPIEVALDTPDAERFATPRGFALVGHPHPLFGGTNTNKVVMTIARALVQLGFIVARPNFRGVGKTAGEHDAGKGEADDNTLVARTLIARFQPASVVLGGFSFGSFVTTHVAQRLADDGVAIEKLVLAGTATSRWNVLPVPAGSLVVHGELDDTVPLSSVLDWARPQDLPVVVVPGADHFFHRKLVPLKHLVLDALAPRILPADEAGDDAA
ncbi:alpha/beta hydrolase [Derxia gummosa]|uniref:Alpha/beta hydrolase n=1 Tax=Derxia gummosa DSM 723 TaxID=1121388 RepID=A0A8B6X8W8_9BURK|nr:alpha/beta hydrolase [Derxia gummosa]